ncbi:MAG: hypothetical protein ACPLRZ_07755 [Thermovenabulum sp.]|uniref:hypothetical protein n=1 Tax=Thermovenabulum sp. TaxID=3100335 RepID=UPI003C798484
MVDRDSLIKAFMKAKGEEKIKIAAKIYVLDEERGEEKSDNNRGTSDRERKD